MTARGNGPEPADGSWVFAATDQCPARIRWHRVGPLWHDAHGCKREWGDLVEPVDALPPEGPGHPGWE